MFIFTKVSLTISFIMVITIIAEYFGILDKKYSTYIILIGFAIQIIILIIFIILLIIRYMMFKKLDNGIKIIRHKFEDVCIKGQTDVLPKSINPTNPMKPSIFKIYIEVKDFKEPPDFGVIMSGKGRVNVSDMKKRMSNVATGIKDSLFIFHADIIVRPNENINFQFKTDANIKTFFVGEIYIP